MSQGELIIIALRLAVPLLILRWNLAGGIIAMLLDGADVIIIDALGRGGFGDHYHTLDKVLDGYYLTLELLVALRWQSPWARTPAIALFIYRAIGVVLFEVTHRRIFLFFFPNMFENWWLYVVVVRQFWPRLYPCSLKTTAIPLALLLIPKMGQEYLLHFTEAKPWQFIKRQLGWES
jgi:hypothetical protein